MASKAIEEFRLKTIVIGVGHIAAVLRGKAKVLGLPADMKISKIGYAHPEHGIGEGSVIFEISSDTFPVVPQKLQHLGGPQMNVTVIGLEPAKKQPEGQPAIAVTVTDAPDAPDAPDAG